MTDRNVQWPNRYQLTKVPGTDDIYDLIPAPGTITAEGTMINKASLLTDETAQAYGFTAEELAGVVPDDVFMSLLDKTQQTGWKLIQSYTTAGSFTWTVPDLFNGKSYIIGVLVIGAGGSGAARASDGSSSAYYDAFGGNSGYSAYFTMEVTPGQEYSGVVGKGGDAKTTGSVTGNANAVGENGGSSSFDGVVADGGEGGDGYLSNVGAQISLLSSDAQWGGQIIYSNYSNFNDVLGSPIDCYNPFEQTRMLGAGGFAERGTNSAYSGGKNPLTGLGGGDGKTGYSYTTNPVKGGDATDAGCGGGGAHIGINSVSGTATSGAGADGAVKIYAQGVQL